MTTQDRAYFSRQCRDNAHRFCDWSRCDCDCGHEKHPHIEDLPQTSHVRDLVAAAAAAGSQLTYKPGAARGKRTGWTFGPLTVYVDDRGYFAGYVAPGLDGRTARGRSGLDSVLRYAERNQHPLYSRPFWA